MLFIEHDEALIDKTTYDLLWENLAANLNDIGPPDHTVSEWRRIWSVHKHNKKRKRLVESSESDTEVPASISHLGDLKLPCDLFDDLSLNTYILDQPSCSVSVADENGPSKLAEKLDIIIGNQAKLSMKMDVVIGNQTIMIANQTVIIQELQSSNTQKIQTNLEA